MPPTAREIRQRARSRARRRTERRGARFQARIEEGTLSPEAAARRLEAQGQRVGGRVGRRVARRRGGNEVAGARRGARVGGAVGARVGRRRSQVPAPAPDDGGLRTGGGGINRPDRPGDIGRDDPLGEGHPTPGEQFPIANGTGGGGVDDGSAFLASFSAASNPIIEAGARAIAARRARQQAIQRLLALGDPRILSVLSGL